MALLAHGGPLALVTDTRVQLTDGRLVREGNPKHVHTCAAFSPSGKVFAISTDEKILYVYDAATWTLSKTFQCEKRLAALKLTNNDQRLVAADKSGDIYLRFDLSSESTTGTRIAGHVSMLFDIVLTSDEKYIISCDRDEKLRVSFFPEAWEIENFCLGHTEMVTTLAITPTTVLSGSADGTVRLWQFSTGRCLAALTLTEFVPSANSEPHSIIKVAVSANGAFAAVISARCHAIALLAVSATSLTFVRALPLAAQPWSAVFIDSSLWVTCESPAAPLLRFAVAADGTVQDEPIALPDTLTGLGAPCTAVQAGTNTSTTATDNSTIYFSRKEQRVNRRGKRAGSDTEDAGESKKPCDDDDEDS